MGIRRRLKNASEPYSSRGKRRTAVKDDEAAYGDVGEEGPVGVGGEVGGEGGEGAAGGEMYVYEDTAVVHAAAPEEPIISGGGTLV